MSSMGAMKPERREDSETHALIAGLTELSVRAGHDMVGPLNQAGSLLALFIKRHKGQIDAEADQLLDYLQGASVRMEGVVNGLRRYMESVGHTPLRTMVDLNETLDAAQVQLQKKIRESQSVIESEPLPVVWADSEQMAVVFENLLDNSIKFCVAGAPVHIRVSSSSNAEGIAVTVSDAGIGIDPEHSEAIFLPFRRLNGREYPGAGLGLAAVKTIVEMHGGDVRLAPQEGCSGAAIEFTLPVPA
jgi:light-regulated signal transduction histidine kinase (bacteriophytochrome)